jgi:hypothetical protein
MTITGNSCGGRVGGRPLKLWAVAGPVVLDGGGDGGGVGSLTGEAGRQGIEAAVVVAVAIGRAAATVMAGRRAE